MQPRLGLALALVGSVIVALSLFAAGEAGVRSEAEKSARAQALNNLAGAALAIKLDERRTVRDFSAATDLPKTDIRAMLQGAVEYRPAEYYEDGSCHVRVSLTGEQLRANLQRIQQDYYKKQDGEFAGEKFDLVANEKVIEGVGASPAPPGRGASMSSVTDGIPGWGRIPARQRINAEKSAYQSAIADLRAEVQKQESPLLGDPAVKEAFEKRIATLRPDSKTYLPGGIVEVKVSIDVGSLVPNSQPSAAEAQAPGIESDEASANAMQEKAAGKRISGVGYARIDGQPVDLASVKRASVPIDLGAVAEIPFGQGN